MLWYQVICVFVQAPLAQIPPPPRRDMTYALRMRELAELSRRPASNQSYSIATRDLDEGGPETDPLQRTCRK
jgi:hypothetical protein